MIPHRVCRKYQQASQNQLMELERNQRLVISHKIAMLEMDTQMKLLVAKQETNHRERQVISLTSSLLQQKERKRLRVKTVSQSQQRRRKQNQQERQSKEAKNHREALLNQEKEEKGMQKSEVKTIK